MRIRTGNLRARRHERNRAIEKATAPIFAATYPIPGTGCAVAFDGDEATVVPRRPLTSDAIKQFIATLRTLGRSPIMPMESSAFDVQILSPQRPRRIPPWLRKGIARGRA